MSQLYSIDATDLRDVWLVKVPKYMANAWKATPQCAQLGKLQVPKNSSGPIKFILDPKLQAAQEANSKLPNEHTLSLQPLSQQRMVILDQNKEPTEGATAEMLLKGEVKSRGELRPTGDLSYMSLKTSLIRQAAKPTKVTKIIDKAVSSYKPRGAAQLALEADRRKKKEEGKKTIREDKEVVQGRLFSAFEKQQYYNIKDLVRITNQSIPYLKEILKEICNYCSKSTHKNMWELKPEYRHYKASSGSQSGSK